MILRNSPFTLPTARMTAPLRPSVVSPRSVWSFSARRQQSLHHVRNDGGDLLLFGGVTAADRIPVARLSDFGSPAPHSRTVPRRHPAFQLAERHGCFLQSLISAKAARILSCKMISSTISFLPGVGLSCNWRVSMKVTTWIPTRRNDGSEVSREELNGIFGLFYAALEPARWTGRLKVIGRLEPYQDNCIKLFVACEESQLARAEEIVRNASRSAAWTVGNVVF